MSESLKLLSKRNAVKKIAERKWDKIRSEDIAQDCALKVLEGKIKLSQDNFRSYIDCLRNGSETIQRRGTDVFIQPIYACDLIDADAIFDKLISPEKEEVSDELYRITRYLYVLQPRELSTLILKFFCGWSHEDIAKKFNCHPSLVTLRLKTALNKIRGELKA